MQQKPSQQQPNKKEDPSKTMFRDRFDPTNAAYFEAERQKELQQQQLQQRPGYLRRKMDRIFGGLGHTGGKFIMGFGQGCMVGAVIGVVTGAFVAIKTRRISFFLISPIVSGASFGFIMGVGTLLRSAPMKKTDSGPYPEGKEWILRKL